MKTLIYIYMEDSTTVVHLKKKAGIIVQDCDIYIGRPCFMGGWSLSGSKWANPYSLKEYSIDVVLEKYETYIRNRKDLMNSLGELRGKRLGCWCKPAKCHGDILIKLLKENIEH